MAQKKIYSEETWEAIKQAYITEKCGFQALGRRFGVPYVQIRSRANGEDWKSERAAYMKNIHEMALDKIAAEEAQNAYNTVSRAFKCADKIMDKLELSIEMLVPEDRYGLLQCTNVLKGLKEIGMFRAELDRMEQEARIAKLRKDAEGEENKDSTIIVRFEGDIDEYGD